MRTTMMLVATALATMAPGLVWAQDNDSSAVDTALTLYNQGPAVVQQTRRLQLQQGRQTIVWPSASTRLVAQSLWLAGDGVRLVEALVPAGEVGPQAMLARREGRSVTLVSSDGETRREATLVSVSGSNVIVRVDDRLEYLDGEHWRITWPATHTDGALQLSVQAQASGEQPLTLTYQRGKVNWQASYTGQYDAEQGRLTLQSLAVVHNGANAPVQADQVALVAGNVNRTAGPNAPQPYMMARAASAKAVSGPQQAGGYYRYELAQPLALPAGATRVLALMDAQSVAVSREYRIEGSWYRGSADQRTHATIRLTFDNTTGKPLPAGPVRIYGHGQAMLLGADKIGNIPVGAPVTLRLGQAFDVTARRRVTASSESGKTHKRSMQITVYNARDEATRVTLAEALPQGARIVSESDEHVRKSARQALWKLQVPADGKTQLSYTVQWPQ